MVGFLRYYITAVIIDNKYLYIIRVRIGLKRKIYKFT